MLRCYAPGDGGMMQRKAFIDELLMRGLLPGERTSEALAQVDSPAFASWIDKQNLDRDGVVAARCAVWGLPPAPRTWLLAPTAKREPSWDVRLFRQLGCVPVAPAPGEAGPLAVVFADPEVALSPATKQALPPFTPYLVDVRELLRLQGVVLGTSSDDSSQSLAVNAADIDGAVSALDDGPVGGARAIDDPLSGGWLQLGGGPSFGPGAPLPNVADDKTIPVSAVRREDLERDDGSDAGSDAGSAAVSAALADEAPAASAPLLPERPIAPFAPPPSVAAPPTVFTGGVRVVDGNFVDDMPPPSASTPSPTPSPTPPSHLQERTAPAPFSPPVPTPSSIPANGPVTPPRPPSIIVDGGIGHSAVEKATARLSADAVAQALADAEANAEATGVEKATARFALDVVARALAKADAAAPQPPSSTLPQTAPEPFAPPPPAPPSPSPSSPSSSPPSSSPSSPEEDPKTGGVPVWGAAPAEAPPGSVGPGEVNGFTAGLPPKIGSYVLGPLLGQGGMAAVFLARDEVQQRQVALKLLNPAVVNATTLERFKREALAGVQLRHDNVVATYDAGSEAGHHYIAAEFVEGGTVRDLMARMGPFPPLLAVKVIVQVLDALGAAHGRGIIHRDLKPANLLVTKQGVVKLGDFGVAKAHNDETLTAAGVVFGTPSYMSPEQALGEKIDARSDLYACGTLFFQLLTGVNPFANENLSASLLMVAKGEVPEILERQPTLPELIGDVMRKLMARDREDRYQTTHEVKAALRPLLELTDACWPTVIKDALKEPIQVREELYLQQARCEQARARVCMRDKPQKKMEAAWALRRSLELDRGDQRALQLLRRLCQQEGYSFDLPADESLRTAVQSLRPRDKENPLILRKLALGCFEQGALEHAVRLLRLTVAASDLGDSVVEQRLSAIVGEDPVSPFRHLPGVGRVSLVLDRPLGAVATAKDDKDPSVAIAAAKSSSSSPSSSPSGGLEPLPPTRDGFDVLAAAPAAPRIVPIDQLPDRSTAMPVANLVEPPPPRPATTSLAAAQAAPKKTSPLLYAAGAAVLVVVAVLAGRWSAGGAGAADKPPVVVSDEQRQRDQLDKAQRAFSAGDLGKALDEVGVAIAIDKTTATAAEAFLLSGKIQQGVGNLSDARGAYETAMTHPQAAPKVKQEASSLRFLLP